VEIIVASKAIELKFIDGKEDHEFYLTVCIFCSEQASRQRTFVHRESVNTPQRSLSRPTDQFFPLPANDKVGYNVRLKQRAFALL
jgi:hypothetical protein